ncbi:MAG: biotin carboxylase N-terminal domain-containing protein [Burkholderiaceae bacterium]
MNGPAPRRDVRATPFDTLLIANRGEIACRVIDTARRLGLRTVAVHSDADRDARHVRLADLAVPIGPAAARDSYLSIPRVIDACRRAGAQAVHPGYGFLSENADFARACDEAGLVFVGPPAAAIDALGNKSAAKQLARRIGVPCLPGYADAGQDEALLVAEARKIGTPLMIKAAAGGGGRGMRRCDDVDDEAALIGLLRAARTEALGAFGDGTLLLERLLETARHVEVQVFGDRHGGYVYLGERDCSTQRRNQKVLEEAPAPGVDAGLRQRMGEAAVRLAREVGYVGAGTIEYLLAPDGQFYFLEMNTRLQVEHPVTEAITGLDLVEWQLRVAQGEPLPLGQDEIRLDGHAIEARLCAEDAFAGFVPQSGRIDAWSLAEGQDVRVDHGLAPQASISPHYDSMIAKLIAHGSDREQARRKLIAALQASTIAGLTTNRDYLIACLRDPHFVAPALSTRWLADASGSWCAPTPDARWIACAAALRVDQLGAAHGDLASWSSAGAHERPLRLRVGDQTWRARVRTLGEGRFEVAVRPSSDASGEAATFSIGIDAATPGLLDVDGLRLRGRYTGRADAGYLDLDGIGASFDDLDREPPTRSGGEHDGEIVAKMHGQIVAVNIADGQPVSRGQILLSIEAMKMEHRIAAPIDGLVRNLAVAVGQQVAPDRLMLRIEAPAAETQTPSG